MSKIKRVQITRDNWEYQCGNRTFMAVRTAPGGVRTDWSVIELDTEEHGVLFKNYYKTNEIESAIMEVCA